MKSVKITRKLFETVTGKPLTANALTRYTPLLWERFGSPGGRLRIVLPTTGEFHYITGDGLASRPPRKPRAVQQGAARGTIEKSPVRPPLRAPEEVAAERLSICRGCETFNPERQRCNRCSCGGNGKYDRASGKCPLGKWPEFDLADYLAATREHTRPVVP